MRTAPAEVTPDPAPGSPHRLGRVGFARLLLVVLALIGLGGWWLHGQSSPAPLTSVAPADVAPTWDYVIPPGTAARIAHGEQVDILPSPLEVKVGQVIRIRNDDTQGQLIGPFYVGAGETMTQRFAAPGRLQGACQIHASGKLVVDISAN